jgi:hypothetical protein
LQRDVINQHPKSAALISKQIIKFLEDNSGVYTSYVSSQVNNKASERMDFRVIGNNYSRERIVQ